MSENNKNKYNFNNILYQIVNKNTEVMTNFCDTLESVEKSLEEVSKGYISETEYRNKIMSKLKIHRSILIVILILVFLIFIILNAGGYPGWLVDAIELI